MKKIIIGAGGGYDIVVAAMLRNRLLHGASVEIDLGGFLNPKFVHFFSNDDFVDDITDEQAINKSLDVIRFRRLPCNTHDTPINRYQHYKKYGEIKDIVDSRVRKSVGCPVYNFSLRFSMDSIVQFLNDNYAEIIVCDVGGDILFSGQRDNMIKTPIIDAFALAIARRYAVKKSAFIYLLGLGIDGELYKKNIEMNLSELDYKKAILSIEYLDQTDVDFLKQFYNQVKFEENSGKTNRLLIDIWENNIDKNDIAKKRNIHDMEQWFNKIFIVEANKLASMNPLSAVDNYNDMLNMLQEFGVSCEGYMI